MPVHPSKRTTCALIAVAAISVAAGRSTDVADQLLSAAPPVTRCRRTQSAICTRQLAIANAPSRPPGAVRSTLFLAALLDRPTAAPSKHGRRPGFRWAPHRLRQRTRRRESV